MPTDPFEVKRYHDRLDPTLFVWMDAIKWHPELHDSTAPEAIARDQQDAIRAVMGDGLTVAEISDRVILPVSVVRRRLIEMGIEPRE